MNLRVTTLAWPFLVLFLYTNPTAAEESASVLVSIISGSSDKDRVRDAATALRGKLGPKDKSAISQLVSTLSGSGTEYRVRAAGVALQGSQLGPESKSAINQLVSTLSGSGTEYRVRAAGVALQGNLDFAEAKSAKERLASVARGSTKYRASAARTALATFQAGDNHSPYGRFTVTTYKKLFILVNIHSGEVWIFPAESSDPISLQIQKRFDDKKDAMKWIKKQ